MNTRFHASTLALLLTLSGTSWAATLTEVYSTAKTIDAQYLQAQARYKATLELLPQAKALLLPTVKAAASATYSDTEQPNIALVNIAPITYTSTTAEDASTTNLLSLSVSQPVFNAGTFALKRQADANVDQAEATLKAAEQTLIVRVAGTYFSILAAEDNVEFSLAEQKAIERQLEQTKKRHEVGLIPATDVYEVQARYDLTKAQVILARNSARSAYEAMREITGQRYPSLAALGTSVPLKPASPDNVVSWQDTAVKSNPAYLSADAAVVAAQENVKYRRSGHLPTASLLGSYSASDKSRSTLNGDTNTASITLSVSVPLYEGGAVNSRTREAEFQYEEALKAREAVRNSLTRQISDAYWGIDAGISRVKALSQAVESAKVALKATDAGYQVGTRTIVDVLNAERERHRAERDLKQAKYDYLLSRLALKQAAGTLAMSDVEEVNQLLAE